MGRPFTRLKAFYSNLRIKYKLFLLISTLMLIMCVCCLTVLQYVFNVYDRELYARSSQALNVTLFGMDNELSQMEQLTFRIATDQNVQRTLRHVRDNTTSYDFLRVTDDLNTRMIELGTQDKYVLSVHTFDTNYREYRTGKRPNTTNTERLKQIEELTHARQGAITWILPDEYDQTLIAAREIRDYSDFSFDRLGILGLRIDLDRLARDYARGLDQQGAHFLILNEGEPIFQGDAEIDPDKLQVVLDSAQGYEVVEDNGRLYFATYAPSSYTNWDYVIMIPYDELFQVVANVKRFVTIIFPIILVLTIVLSFRYARRLTRPIESLNAKMKSIQMGRFDIAATLEDEQYPMDETGQMHRNFRIMVQRINDLINENYLKQLAIKESEYKALQAQINPHFLYNTLESINWHAKIAGQPHISRMVESLAYLMRHSINQQEPLVTLGEEMTFISHYITIQKVRFEERLDFRMDIPEELRSCVVPKLVLQPLVENAIQYGLERIIGTCSIRISASRREHMLVIEVHDNGPGIDQKAIELIFAGKLRTRKTGLGIRNIHERIRLMFGEEYGLQIESKPGEGTTVRIRVPYNWRDA